MVQRHNGHQLMGPSEYRGEVWQSQSGAVHIPREWEECKDHRASLPQTGVYGGGFRHAQPCHADIVQLQE